MTAQERSYAETLAARILERTSSHDEAEDAVLDLMVTDDVRDAVMARIDRAHGR